MNRRRQRLRAGFAMSFDELKLKEKFMVLRPHMVSRRRIAARTAQVLDSRSAWSPSVSVWAPQGLRPSQESVEIVSKYCLFLRTQAKDVARVWEQAVTAVRQGCRQPPRPAPPAPTDGLRQQPRLPLFRRAHRRSSCCSPTWPTTSCTRAAAAVSNSWMPSTPSCCAPCPRCWRRRTPPCGRSSCASCRSGLRSSTSATREPRPCRTF